MTHKLKNMLLIGLVCAPCFVWAQTKPKRDTTKDRSVVIAKQQAQAKRNTSQPKNVEPPKQQEKAKKNVVRQTVARNRVQTTERKRTQHSQTTPPSQTTRAPKSATYLRVDQQNYFVTKHLPHTSGSIVLTISTNGKDWSISSLPKWCKAEKYDCYVTLKYDRNTEYDERYASLFVNSDNQRVRVDFKQDGAPLNITSCINYAYLTHTMQRNALRVNANVSIQGAKGQKCLIVAFIKDESGNIIKASRRFSNYGLQSSNYLCVTKEVTPANDNMQNYNVAFDIPNNAMQLYKKKNKLSCELSIYCVKTETYVSMGNYSLPFKAKVKKSNVATKIK